MKLAAARRHWKWSLFASAGIAGGIAALDWNEPAASVITAAPGAAGTMAVGLPVALPAREVGRLRTDPFAARSWAPAPTPALAPAPVQAPPARVEPAVPPLPYRIAGTVQQGRMLTVVLGAGERIHLVKGGEVLDELYRVQAVSRTAVTLVYLPLGVELQLAHAPEAPPPAAGLVARAAPDLRP